MNPLIIQGSQATPTVTLDHVSGKFEISGRSLPANSVKFYAPICEWLEEYKRLVLDNFTFDIKLEYFDTSSSKCLFDIFKILKEMQESGSSVKINWFYVNQDYDMKERGEEYQSISELPFTLVKYQRIVVKEE